MKISNIKIDQIQMNILKELYVLGKEVDLLTLLEYFKQIDIDYLVNKGILIMRKGPQIFEPHEDMRVVAYRSTFLRLNSENVFELRQNFELDLYPNESIEKLFEISKGTNWSDDMSYDSLIANIVNAMEYKLKIDNGWVNVDSFDGRFSNDYIKKYRTECQIFRHSNEDSLKERQNYNNNQKIELIHLGYSILSMILDKIPEQE